MSVEQLAQYGEVMVVSSEGQLVKVWGSACAVQVEQLIQAISAVADSLNLVLVHR